jgi:transcriptional regulator with PAS, ATPase and Fis domain
MGGQSSVTLNDLLSATVDSLELAMVVDSSGRIRYVNKSYANILRREADELVGLPVGEIVPNSRLPQVLKTGREELGQIFILNNGVPTICNRFPIRNSEGGIIGAFSAALFDDLEQVSRLNAEIEKLRGENEWYRRKLASYWKKNMYGVVGESPAMQKLKSDIERLAAVDIPVLLSGETGTGKEVFASLVHRLSRRAAGRSVKINCAAIPKDLLESELFGYAEGAFSGAAKGGRIGRLESAEGGSVLLDEIGEMPMELQAKLLRVLQERELERLGSNDSVRLDIRLICCTNQKIFKLVEEGKFRRDLYYRVNTVELEIPPLRERHGDIALLCDFLINKINERHGCWIERVDSAVLARFENYSWPGNVRELEHVLERACVMAQHGVLSEKQLDFFLHRATAEGQTMPEQGSLDKKRQNAEREAILTALSNTGGNRSEAARQLNISRSRLYDRIRRYGIDGKV